MSLTDLCNRPTARAPENPLDSHAEERFAAPSAQVEARLTPRLQLRSRLRRSPRCPRGEERPTGRGASQRRRSQPLAALKARSLTPFVPWSGRARLGRTDCAVVPSRSTSRSIRSACRRHVPPAPARAGQDALPTSAITAVLQHNCGQTVHPARRKRSFPLCAAMRAACTSRCKAGRAALNQRPPRARGHRQRLLLRSLAEELHPNSRGPDTSCRGAAPAPVEEPVRRKRNIFPRIRRRTAHKAPSAQGLPPPPRREEGLWQRTRGAFRRQAAQRADTIIHRLFPTCGKGRVVPLSSPPDSRGVDMPRRGGVSPTRGLPRRSLGTGAAPPSISTIRSVRS